jgi:hypothetical protein
MTQATGIAYTIAAVERPGHLSTHLQRYAAPADIDMIGAKIGTRHWY